MDFCVFLFFFGIEVSIKEIVMRERGVEGAAIVCDALQGKM